MISHELALALWERALGAKLGILVPTNDVNYLMQTLYAARRDAEDARYERLSLVKGTKGVYILDRERCEDVRKQRLAQGNGESE